MTPSDTAHPEGEMLAALRRLHEAVRTLSQTEGGVTLFEASPTKSQRAFEAWTELDGAQKQAAAALSTPPSRPQGEEGLWRPISEAPTTGVRIVGMNPLWAEDRRVRVVWWVDNGPGLDEGQYWQDDADSEPDPEFWQPLPAISNQGKPSS